MVTVSTTMNVVVGRLLYGLSRFLHRKHPKYPVDPRLAISNGKRRSGRRVAKYGANVGLPSPVSGAEAGPVGRLILSVSPQLTGAGCRMERALPPLTLRRYGVSGVS